MSTSLQKDFGNKLRTLRLSKGLSQERLAELASLDRTYISGIERGLRNPSLNNIGKIGRALKVPLTKLF